MRRIPGARDVDAVLKKVDKAVKNCLEELHQQAAKAMAKGKYDVAEHFIAKGKEIKGFHTQMDGLRKQWRALKGVAEVRKVTRNSTALWKYYKPILQALEGMGGEATRAEIEPEVEKLMRPDFERADIDKMAGGSERWKIMVRRARKNLVSEGWLEAGTGKRWRITPTGRNAARTDPE